jgi:hypothetical protein
MQKWFTSYILLLVLVGLSFGVFLHAESRGADFMQFLIDRREGAGQTQPDRGAECKYHLTDTALIVDRKAHGQKTEHTITLTDVLLEGHFGGQEALIETASSVDTYNCTNAEFLSHAIKGDASNPVGRVFFSSSGRNVAITLLRDGKERAVEVFKFRVDTGDSVWNEKFGPEEKGLEGAIEAMAMTGESLVVVLRDKKSLVHSYNYRASHKESPWNGHSAEHAAFAVDTLNEPPVIIDRGKRATLTATIASKKSIFEYDFTCKRKTPEGATTNPKPCVWKEQ